MKKQRLKLIVLTSVVFGIALLVTAVFAGEIVRQSDVLREQVTAIQQDQAQQSQLTRFQKVADDTRIDRTQLNSYYLSSQSDTIDFLNYIEQLAVDQGVELDTITATQEALDNKQFLLVEYTVLAGRQSVERFVGLLETLPHVSEVTGLDLKQRSPVSWEARVQLEVIILETYETAN